MKLKFKTKLAFFLIISATLPITMFGLVSFVKSRNMLMDGLKEQNRIVIEQENKYHLSGMIRNLEGIVEAYAESELAYGVNIDAEEIKLMRKNWTEYKRSDPDIEWIYYGGVDGQLVVSADTPLPEGFDPRERPWYKNAMSNPDRVIWNSAYKDVISGKPAVSVSRTIRNLATGRIIGVFGIDVALERFSSEVSGVNRKFNGFTIICDKNGIILHHQEKDWVGSDFSRKQWMKKVLSSDHGDLNTIIRANAQEGNKMYFASFITMPSTGWKLISFVPDDTVPKAAVPILKMTVMLSLICVAFSFCIGHRIIRQVDSRMKKIVRHMEEVEKGNFSYESSFEGDEILGELNHKFNEMSLSISNMMNEARLQSMVDGLTGMFNHNCILEKLEEEIGRVMRYSGKLSIMMADVDFFKRINDSYGHQVGDEALKKIATVLKQAIRETDIAGRYGGEEFLIIMPGIDLEECMSAADRIRRSIERIEWTYGDKPLTISIGIAQLIDENADELVQKADVLLYRAKENGRNRVEK